MYKEGMEGQTEKSEVVLSRKMKERGFGERAARAGWWMMEWEDLNWKGVVIAQKAIRTMYLFCMLFRLEAAKQAERAELYYEYIQVPETAWPVLEASWDWITLSLEMNQLDLWSRTEKAENKRDVVSSCLSIRNRGQSVLILAAWHADTHARS